MSLTILGVAYPFARVGPDAVGGAEQVLSRLDAALVRAGHRSIVIACAGSVVSGTLVPTPLPQGTLTRDVRRRAHEHFRRVIDETVRRYGVDLVHLHGVDFAEYLPESDVPALVTLHLP